VIGLETLRPYEEVRDPARLSVPANPNKSGEVRMARLLIDQMSAEGWDPAEHPNAYRRSLRKLLASKKRFSLAAPEEEPKAARGNVIDLMDALKRSLEQPRPRASARGGRRRAGAA
jgi:non-homologous end joining protein Ku